MRRLVPVWTDTRAFNECVILTDNREDLLRGYAFELLAVNTDRTVPVGMAD